MEFLPSFSSDLKKKTSVEIYFVPRGTSNLLFMAEEHKIVLFNSKICTYNTPPQINGLSNKTMKIHIKFIKILNMGLLSFPKIKRNLGTK